MDENYKSISLKQLKEDINQLNFGELGLYFDNELSMADYRKEDGYSIIIEFFNHLKDEYNKCISNDYEQAMGYHDILFKVFNWFIPFLNPYHKIIVKSNICILTDDEQDSEFYKEHFRDSLKSTNQLIETIGQHVSNDRNDDEKQALCLALDAIGYLNIREHNYEYAIICLRLCIDLLSNFGIDNLNHFDLFDLYIKSIVRLANCYEYTDKSWDAIKLLLNLDLETANLDVEWKKLINTNAEKIRLKIINYYRLQDNELTSKDATINIVKDICNLLVFDNSKNQYFNVFKLNKNKNPLHEILKSYIHVLAHCISEFAAKIRETKYSHPFCSTLQIVSRFLLDWLVVSCHEETLVTCQATVRAENDACPEALKLLLERYMVLDNKLGNVSIDEQSELQEIEFFLFYFAEQELRYNYTDTDLENIFKRYGDKFFISASDKAENGDFDSLFHYYVIEFKYLFKQKVDEFIHSSDTGQLSMQEIDNIFLDMCRCKDQCSDQIFNGLIDECERLEKLFELFQQLLWLNDKSIRKCKYDSFCQLWYLYDKNSKPNNIDIKVAVSKIYEEIIKKNKILILAPVKNAPSCSSEYDNVQCLLEIPALSVSTSYIDCNQFMSAFNRIKRNRKKMVRYYINSSDEYSNLKWALFYPNKSNFIYLYMKKGESIEYSEVVSIYLDTEQKAITNILEKIDYEISDELNLSVFRSKICNDLQNTEKCNNCNTLLLKPSDNGELRKLIDELLVFLEFDFYSARKIGYLEKEHILINYPKDDDLFILAFDNSIAREKSGQGYCDLCKSCFMNSSQEHLIKENKPLIDSAHNICKQFPNDILINARSQVHKEIDVMTECTVEEKERIKAGMYISKQTSRICDFVLLCKRLDCCIEKQCDKLENEECKTCELLKEYNFL